MQYVPPSQMFGASRRGQQPDIYSPLIPLVMPRGKMDVTVRLATYLNGSRALELRDADGIPFYWPTLLCDPTTMLGLLSPEVADDVILAIRASAVKNGIAHALMEAGLLVDLQTEIPVDRYYVSLMRHNITMMPDASPLEAAQLELTLKPLPVPAVWEPTYGRIQQVFCRHGKRISMQDAILAWAAAGGIARVPPALLPSGEEIHERLRKMFEPQAGSSA